MSDEPRIFDETLLADFANVSKSAYPEGSKTTDTAHNRWKLIEAPAGPGLYHGITRDGHTAGRIVVQRRDLRLGSSIHRGGHPVDLLVDQQRRKATDALQLVARLPKSQGFDLIFHTCNANAAPIYAQLSRFYPNYVARFELLPFGLPLRVRRPLAALARRDIPGMDALSAPWRWGAGLTTRMPARVRVTQEPPAPAALDALLDAFAAKAGLHSVRTADVLRWRFASGPLFRGDVAYLYERDRLTGYAATTMTAFDSVKVLALMDAVWDPSSQSTVAAIKRLALSRALDQGADLLFTLLNPKSPLAARLTGFPFLPLPQRLLKHPTPIFVVDIDRALAATAARDDAYILLTDLDYF